MLHYRLRFTFDLLGSGLGSVPVGLFQTDVSEVEPGLPELSFSIGWLPAGDRQAYFVEICDQILVALFCITGRKSVFVRTCLQS